MQMDGLMTTHVVGLTRIDEEVGLSAGGDASLEERECMLRNDNRVVESDDDLQLALQVLSLVEQ